MSEKKNGDGNLQFAARPAATKNATGRGNFRPAVAIIWGVRVFPSGNAVKPRPKSPWGYFLIGLSQTVDGADDRFSLMRFRLCTNIRAAR